MTFADRTCGMTARYVSGKPKLATVQLDTHFVEAGKIGEVLVSKPHVVRSTRSLIFITTEVTVDRRCIAMASGVFKILKNDAAAVIARSEPSNPSSGRWIASLARNDGPRTPMQYRQLGRSGLKISPICLGTMMFGGPTDEATSSRIVAKAREAGINFIDSADAYNGGKSEQVVGRAISNGRQNWVLATKLANQIGDDPNRGGLSRRWVLQAAEESLKRLGTDYIDIYYLHKEDHATPLEETVRAMGDLMRQGKIRYFGVSNYRAWRVAEICNICDRNGIDRPVVSQPYYNAMNRMPEVEHFPACGYYGLGIVPYSPLARGVLTGKYAPRCRARQGHARGPQRQAHDADRMAAGIAAARAADQAARRSHAASPPDSSRCHGC